MLIPGMVFILLSETSIAEYVHLVAKTIYFLTSPIIMFIALTVVFLATKNKDKPENRYRLNLEKLGSYRRLSKVIGNIGFFILGIVTFCVIGLWWDRIS